MRRFMITPFAAVFLCALAFLFPLKPAMAKVTAGTASCPAGKIKRMGNAVGCVIPLKVRPPGGGGGSRQNDWGMCGVLHISGNFGPPTVARIIVDGSGYYAVELEAFKASVIPKLDWTCALFTDFKGVPPAAKAKYFPAPAYKDGSKGGSQNIKGSAGHACIWAGLFGNLETITGNGTDGAFGYALAQFYGPETKIGAWNVTSYAFCSGYTAAWKGWSYLLHGNRSYAPKKVTSLGGPNEAHDWCYMDRIQANLSYPTYSVGPISAGIRLSGGNYSIAAAPPGGVWMSYNCLPLKQ